MASEGASEQLRPEPAAPSRPLRLAADAELVSRARAGANDAFDELVRRYRAALERYCVRLLGADRAEDAVQETLLKALVAVREGASPPAEIRPWLYRVAHNVSIDLIRRSARESGAACHDEPSAEPPMDLLERRHTLRVAVREIRSLPDRQRHALLLRAFEEREYGEIATALEASEGVVRQLVYRARERVRASAAAVVCPLWVLRLGHRGGATAAVSLEQASGGTLAAGAGVKVVASVLAAGAVVTGSVALHGHHGHAAHRVVAEATPGADAHLPPVPASITSARPPVHLAAAHTGRVSTGPARKHRSAPRSLSHHQPSSGPGTIAPPPAPAMTHQATPPAPPHHDPTPQPPTPTTSGGPGTASPASTDPSPPAPPPSHEQPASNPPPPPPSDSGKQPAPAKAGEVRSYQQSAGFGGPLTITRSNGEAVSYFFGEKTQLSCYSVDTGGNAVSYATCTKDRLKPGAAVARAVHGPNQYGTDVWTVIDLIVPAA